jgi:hypothetical protein
MQVDDNKRWEKIYGNVVSQGTKIKKRRNIMKISAFAVFVVLFASVLTLNVSEKKVDTDIPEGYAYTEDNIEIALIAQGVFFDEEFGLLID